MNRDSIQLRRLSDAEQRLALPLLGRCFPAYWEQLAMKASRFPYRETSYGAFDGDRLVAHCGVLEYHVCDNACRWRSAGGIASVATDKPYRHMGLARDLCIMAAEDAMREGLESLSLYTEFDRVYESAGWQVFRHLVKPMRLIVGPCAECRVLRPIPGGMLDKAAREGIIALYESSAPFPGKVRRGFGDEFHGWPRLFSDPDYMFACHGGMYAIAYDGAIVEALFPAEADDSRIQGFLAGLAMGGVLDLHLPPGNRAWQAVSNAGWPMLECPRDLMHREHPMFLDFITPGLHDGAIFYPLADKF